MDGMIRVIIASDIRFYCEGLAAVLPRQSNLQVVATASDPAAAVAEARALQPEVVLVDTAMPGAREAVAMLRARAPQAAIVVVAVPEEEQVILDWAERGVAGYVTREDSVADLASAVESAVRGDLRCSAHIAGTILRRLSFLAALAPHPTADPSGDLTDRELDVLELIERGYSNKRIGRQLEISTATVKNHIHSILRKLHVTRRTEAAAMLRRVSFARGRQGRHA